MPSCWSTGDRLLPLTAISESENTFYVYFSHMFNIFNTHPLCPKYIWHLTLVACQIDQHNIAWWWLMTDLPLWQNFLFGVTWRFLDWGQTCLTSRKCRQNFWNSPVLTQTDMLESSPSDVMNKFLDNVSRPGSTMQNSRLYYQDIESLQGFPELSRLFYWELKFHKFFVLYLFIGLDRTMLKALPLKEEKM